MRMAYNAASNHQRADPHIGSINAQSPPAGKQDHPGGKRFIYGRNKPLGAVASLCKDSPRTVEETEQAVLLIWTLIRRRGLSVSTWPETCFPGLIDDGVLGF
ncbi:MAG: hypothetical protein IPJ00_20950 [Saprospirales bacterium]|nr:hypothetical protein [Saprospirales bacterium]